MGAGAGAESRRYGFDWSEKSTHIHPDHLIPGSGCIYHKAGDLLAEIYESVRGEITGRRNDEGRVSWLPGLAANSLWFDFF